jgi:hypothetical protein
MSASAAFSSLTGNASLSSNVINSFLDGERTSSSTSLQRDLNLRLSRPLTSVISYNFSLRTNLIDSESKDFFANQTTNSYQRMLVPELDVILRKNFYNVSTGYRRKEQWSTAHYSNAGRVSTDFNFFRFDVTPRNLPTLSFNADRQKTYDHLEVKENYTENDTYRIGSTYNLPSRDLRLGYDIAFSGSENRTPLSATAKTERASFNNNYNIGYTGFLLGRKMNYTAGYQGYYTRSRSTLYNTQTGSIVEERIANDGFDAQSLSKSEQIGLSGNSNSALIDDNLTASAGVDLNSVYNHIGIQILFGKTVDRIYVYVDKDLSTETTPIDLSKWEAYKSNTNQANSWTQVIIKSVAAVPYDALNSLYRYEIEFMGQEEAFYFKVINLDTSSVSNVNVTEIEAHGTDEITDLGASTSVSKSFDQGLNLRVGYRPVPKWDFGLKYSINRADENPDSVTDSMSGVVENIFSKSMDSENAVSTTNVTRSYGANAKWLKSGQLNTIMRINRNESFDDTGGVNTNSNSYNFSLNYAPLVEFASTFSALRNETYNFNDKESINDSLVLSADTKLYRNVNMITDMGYSRSESISSGDVTSTYTIGASLDALVTRKLSGTLDLGYNRSVSDTASSSSEDVSTSFSYQAGRLISFSGNFRFFHSDGYNDISTGIGSDWLPLPRIRLNLSYQHRDSETASSITDTVSTYGSWYITKFADIRLSYAYTRTMKTGESENESNNINAGLNCRF